MHIINGYLIITITLRVLLEEKINATLILEMDKHSEITKCQKLDKYIKMEGALFM